MMLIIIIIKIFLVSMVFYNDWPSLVVATNTKDTLEQGQVLNSTSYLISKNGLFTLGFYTLDSNRSYLAIWYTKDFRDHPVWLANRYKSIPIGSGVLTIDLDGRLEVTYSGGSPILLYSSPSPASNLTATLQDNGNLVLRQKKPDGSMSDVLWQSFDHPTDTLLPGMKLGNNLKTGASWILTSWMSANDPANGSFTLEWDANEQRLLVKERGVMFWDSNGLFDNKFADYGLLDDMNLNYNFTTVKNTDEEYLMYSLLIDKKTTESRPFGSKWWLAWDGDIRNGDGRDIFSSFHCKGGNDDHGCKRWEGPKCRKEGDTFKLRSGRFTGGSDANGRTIYNVTLADCKMMCWRHCECSGVKAYANFNGTTCYMYSGFFDKDETGSAVHYYVLFPGPPREKKWISYASIVTASLVAMLFLTILCTYCYLRARKLKKQEKILLELLTMDECDPKEIDQNDNARHNLRIFSVAAILTATQNFSLEYKLGEGGFGPVFKGKLPGGQEVAIKRLSRTSRQGLSEFKSELILVAKLQHTNLVRLLGFSMFREEKMLVYEFMPNKSLDCFIFDASKRELLDWKKRFNIIEGIAQGVLYLHKYSRLKIVHRDLKTSNILLDENMNPKISDFGMARIFRKNESEANTLKPVGTYGYMPPEYAMDGVYSEKSDVYSFGVITLEIISGRKNNSFCAVDPLLNLVGHAWELWKNGAALDLIDTSLNDTGFEDQILRCINIGLLCVEESASHRPTMSEVVSMLTSEGTQLPSPKYPAFQIGRKAIERSRREDTVDHFSVNGLSVSDMVPR